jgi:hypothetical protein
VRYSIDVFFANNIIDLSFLLVICHCHLWRPSRAIQNAAGTDDSGKYDSHKPEVDLGNRYEVEHPAPILPAQKGRSERGGAIGSSRGNAMALSRGSNKLI